MKTTLLVREGAPEIQVSRADGSYLWDVDRKRYIDFVSGWCVGNLGWNHPEITARLKAYDGPEYVSPNLAFRPWEELAGLLVEITPASLTRCVRATGGSEAVDIAMQAAMLHTGRRKFLSIEGSYHGNTIAALSIGASEDREAYPSLLSNCATIAPPLDERALERIERRLSGRDVAAFIMEPIGINLGVLIPERTFMSGLQDLCREHETLLVADEVACGFGRTGRLFASEHFELEPDILCLAKSMSNGVAGIGATLTTTAVAESLSEKGKFYSTYGWHPRSAAAAIATVRYYKRHAKRLMRGVEELSTSIGDRLSRMRFRTTVSTSIIGLAIAIDVGDETYAKRIVARALRDGLLITAQESNVLLLPSLTTEPAVADRALEILESVVR